MIEQSSSVKSFLQILRNATVMMYGILLYTTVEMGVIIFNMLILINPTVQCHTLTPS